MFKAHKPETEKPVCQVAEVVCDGSNAKNGDSTSEQKDLKRAKFPPVMEVKCDTKMTADEVLAWTKGDPGSVFTFKCPAGCKDEGTLIGAGL